MKAKIYRCSSLMSRLDGGETNHKR